MHTQKLNYNIPNTEHRWFSSLLFLQPRCAMLFQLRYRFHFCHFISLTLVAISFFWISMWHSVFSQSHTTWQNTFLVNISNIAGLQIPKFWRKNHEKNRENSYFSSSFFFFVTSSALMEALWKHLLKHLQATSFSMIVL